MKTIAFFSNNSGVGQTTLVFHLGHRLADLGHRVLMVDLDPQSSLTAMCLSEQRLDTLWPDGDDHRQTLLGAVRPLLQDMGDLLVPHVEGIADGLGLLPGDPGLAVLEERLSQSWHDALDGARGPLRVQRVFQCIVDSAATSQSADIVLIDLGPNLGAINRSALLACDFVVMPLAPDPFSIQGLRSLSPTLLSWRKGWAERVTRQSRADFTPEIGDFPPLGYVLMQAGMRLSRPVYTYNRWIARLPAEYRSAVGDGGAVAATPEADPWCLGLARHYQGLLPLALALRKPMFHLRPADGAIGAHMDAVLRCRAEFEALALRLLARIEVLSGGAA